MLGLTGYGSSDEELGDAPPPKPKAKGKNIDIGAKESDASRKAPNEEPQVQAPSNADPPLPEDTMPIGPQIGPSVPVDAPIQDGNNTPSAPLSPYSASRQAVRNLTLPPVPNFNIPDSPPGSPPPGTNEKFARFLNLKKQGIHFNERLESSSALRNPSLLPKLREFAGINDEQQYASSLPEDLAVPTKYPEWAYADELKRLQQDVQKKRQKQRDKIEFVVASGTPSGTSSRNATPGAGRARSGPSSAAERVMAGLDRDSNAPVERRPDTGARKSRFDVR
ncbi:hypothetical protein NA57DRAFT_76255 [Rhizodiscina lignyota]|uniref:HCNGP-domain-containing protein n=1 Tax=Rhizodiscina lignyota TaxID=1504668 RepID=A0A9P4IH16_9PEZI|nr:hypothetical protein NA57DRAFT_76255 [Rhizodiscina lignyota]